MPEFKTPIKMNKLEVKDFKVHVLSSDPTGLVAGDEGLFWYNSTADKLKYWDGTQVVTLGTTTGVDADTLDGQDGTYYLARANHTGTQALSTITGHDKAAHDALNINADTVDGSHAADLLARANHTGTQLASTISDFAEATSDQVGTMVTGNTETGIAVTYDDADNTLDFVLDTEWIQDNAAAPLLNHGFHTNITATYNDASNRVELTGVATYDDEQAQDAVGTILTDTATVDFTYNDATPSITADVLDSPLLQGNNSAYHLSRANHTGTQLHTTISDFDAGVQTNRLDQMAAPTSNVSMGSQKIVSLATPTSDNDAATKAYVDAARQGISAKDPVRVATTAAGTLATSFENGDTIDGVVLSTGDRILIKNQATGSENGIYTVNASGAPTRAADFDTSDDADPGSQVWVNEGTTNGDTQWTLTTDAPITLGTTSLTFTQTSGAGQITAGSGLTKSGNTLNVGAGTGITVNADDVQIADGGVNTTQLANLAVTNGKIGADAVNGAKIADDSIDSEHYVDGSIDAVHLANASVDLGGTKVTGTTAVANGGTGATTAAGARSNLGATGKHAETIGDAAATAFVINHNLGTSDVVVSVRYAAGGQEGIITDWEVDDANNVTVRFAEAPASNEFRVVVVG